MSSSNAVLTAAEYVFGPKNSGGLLQQIFIQHKVCAFHVYSAVRGRADADWSAISAPTSRLQAGLLCSWRSREQYLNFHYALLIQTNRDRRRIPDLIHECHGHGRDRL